MRLAATKWSFPGLCANLAQLMVAFNVIGSNYCRITAIANAIPSSLFFSKIFRYNLKIIKFFTRKIKFLHNNFLSEIAQSVGVWRSVLSTEVRGIPLAT